MRLSVYVRAHHSGTSGGVPTQRARTAGAADRAPDDFVTLCRFTERQVVSHAGWRFPFPMAARAGRDSPRTAHEAAATALPGNILLRHTALLPALKRGPHRP
eukprot:ctg_3482.g503